ncbi:hypothetical protein AB67_1670 [Escherichia coli 5-366-08_S1_C3]|nr:hypothetical protein AB67_1670 [Escherichia coli 5-366-08_S1_C3]
MATRRVSRLNAFVINVGSLLIGKPCYKVNILNNSKFNYCCLLIV